MATVNTAAMNMGTQISFLISVAFFFEKMHSSGIAGSYGSYIFNFFKNLKKIHIWDKYMYLLDVNECDTWTI